LWLKQFEDEDDDEDDYDTWNLKPKTPILTTPIPHSPMSEIELTKYLMVSGVLFALGITGVMLRRNALVVYMALEMNLNAANLALVAFSKYNSNIDGQVLVFFIITVAAAEVAVGLAIIVALFRRLRTVQVDELKTMKW
jgi:NADH-quinone oxidoreductase subunit K